jgi:hypothetical protein
VVEPLAPGEVSIYFPAVKEVSGLKFHMHARFASTVARDSVRDVPENDVLVAAIGHLIVDALPRLRDAGLIGGLLEALPNSEDDLTDRYAVIRNVMTSAFNTERLVPVHGAPKEFAPAKDLVSSPSSFRRALSSSDLHTLATMLFGSRDVPYRWIAERDGRAGKFLAQLGAADFGWSELADLLGYVIGEEEGEPNRDAWDAWLRTLTMKQLRRFYVLLGEHESSRSGFRLRWLATDDEDLRLKELPVIRLVHRGELRHVLGSAAYLPATPKDQAGDRLPLDLAVFPKDAARDAVQLRAFYDAAGVVQWDKSAKVLKRLRIYRGESKPEPDSRQHLADLRLFVDSVRSDPEQAAMFRDVHVLAVEVDDRIRWAVPGACFVDSPVEPTGLSALPPRAGRYRLWSGYREVEGIVDFTRAVGCQTKLVIKAVSVKTHPGFDRTGPSGRATAASTRTGTYHFSRRPSGQAMSYFCGTCGRWP